ncbi:MULTISPECIES: ArsR/SmtB family transcription factor [Hyphomonas]
MIDCLRAAGEPTRLRVLSLLRQRDLSVGELVQVLEQSQPRLSHHLKALTAAGLVERLPEGSFVFYRAATRGAGKAFLDALFAQLDPEEADFVRDRQHLEEVSATRADTAEAYFSSIAENWDRLRSLHYPNDLIESALLELAGQGPFGRVLDFGTGTGRMLSLFAPRAESAEGIDLSHHMLTVARANLERLGIDRARVRQGNVTAVPFESNSADLVIIHQVLHYMDTPNRAISEAARVLRPGGQLLVVDFAPHDLEFLRAEHGHHRLGLSHDAMQAWTSDVGLNVSEPKSFAPPADAADGLTVNIWKAVKSATSTE